MNARVIHRMLKLAKTAETNDFVHGVLRGYEAALENRIPMELTAFYEQAERQLKEEQVVCLNTKDYL